MTPLEKPFALGLAGFGLFLAFGLVTIVGAATREATLEPGMEPDIPLRRRSIRARVIAVIVIVLGLTGGRVWWNAENRAYAAAVFKPVRARVETMGGDSGRMLRLTIDPSGRNERSWTPLY